MNPGWRGRCAPLCRIGAAHDTRGRDGASPRKMRPAVRQDRRRQHGQRRKTYIGGTGSRRIRRAVAVLWWGRRSACGPRGGCIGNKARIHRHPLAGVLSAYGMGLPIKSRSARRRRSSRNSTNPVCLRHAPCHCSFKMRESDSEARIGANRCKRRSHIRYWGSDTTPPCALQSKAAGGSDTIASSSAIMPPIRVRGAGSRSHYRGRIRECVARRASATRPVSSSDRIVRGRCHISMYCPPTQSRGICTRGSIDRELARGRAHRGSGTPADRNATTVVELGWRCRSSGGCMSRAAAAIQRPAVGPHADPVMLIVQHHVHEHRGTDGTAAAKYGALSTS